MGNVRKKHGTMECQMYQEQPWIQRPKLMVTAAEAKNDIFRQRIVDKTMSYCINYLKLIDHIPSCTFYNLFTVIPRYTAFRSNQVSTEMVPILSEYKCIKYC